MTTTDEARTIAAFAAVIARLETTAHGRDLLRRVLIIWRMSA